MKYFSLMLIGLLLFFSMCVAIESLELTYQGLEYNSTTLLPSSEYPTDTLPLVTKEKSNTNIALADKQCLSTEEVAKLTAADEASQKFHALLAGGININLSEPVPGEKRPEASVVMSMVLPGWGQMYNDQVGKGLLMMGIHLGPALVALGSWIGDSDIDIDEDDDGVRLLAGVYAANWIWSIVDAAIVSGKKSRGEFAKYRSPSSIPNYTTTGVTEREKAFIPGIGYGSTVMEVIEKLGKPEKTYNFGSGERWYYTTPNVQILFYENKVIKIEKGS
ncbi:MAG: hypothetical protein QME64_09270 [bacterium]|nr:hypothetical protein [bacterium]